jgi:hypothetical protein
VQWDQPAVSLPFITAIDYVCSLLKTVEIESSVKEAARSLNACSVTASDTDKAVKLFVASVVRAVIPPGILNKCRVQLSILTHIILC